MVLLGEANGVYLPTDTKHQSTRAITMMKPDNRLDVTSSIPAFFAGRSIFVTGGTGFLGKVLVEKILRSCPEVSEIFLLMRPKKGLTIDQRFQKMINMPLFDRLRTENPSNLAKLIPILGDICDEGLGLSSIDRRLLQDKVSIIFHVAANVRFDENLKKDIFSNTRSTRDVCILAGGMKKLVALVHVSSTFAQADKPVVEEVAYPPLVDWRKTVKIVESLDEQTLKTFSAKFLGEMPNTYTFSKRLAEQVITDYSKDLPSVIFRPSIVVSTVDEPVPGWLDNFNGPVGLMIGGGKGILRVVSMDPLVAGDFVPVDVAIKALLTATWKRGLQTITKDPEVHVYNCASAEVRRIMSRELVKMALRINEKIPLEGSVWYPRITLTKSRSLHYILTLILHFLPALMIDGIIKLAGHQPILVKLQRRIYSSSAQLSHFLHNEWTFQNDKLQSLLMEDVPPADQKGFGYNYMNFNMEQYFENCLIGAKLYLLRENMDRVREAKKHMNRMWWIDRLFNIWLTVFLVWILGKAGLFAYILRVFHGTLDGSIFEE